MDLTNIYASLPADLVATFSMVLVALVALALVVWDAFRNNAPGIPWAGVVALGVAIVWELFALGDAPGTAWYGMVRTGGFAAFVNIVVLLGALLSIILSVPYLREIRHAYGEVYAIILFATVGMMLLGTANNLVAVFVGLETMSISLYILTGLVREDEGATESALKYFLLGAFSTGFFLYGIALLYGATGTMDLARMSEGLAAGENLVMFWAGVGLLLVGFLFKVSAAPFHMWTPDVYQGAPTTLTAYMSTATKAATFASLILVLYAALPPERWTMVLAVIAVLTMVVGNVLAIAQQNVKRMLAYSSIAHAGYVLVGLAAGTPAGYAGALFYLLVYSIMNIGAFGVMALLEWDGKEGQTQTLNSLAGIGPRKPLLGATMVVFMFALVGFPPLGGFWGKVAVFAPAVEAGLTWLVIVGVLASAVSAYYYLRVLYVFWMRSPEDEPEAAAVQDRVFAVPVTSAAVLIVCVVLLLYFGVRPGGILETTASFFAGPGASMALLP
ncbi:NADH-quinone oxidoreductase subunit N [Rhodothermaceae bacterium RA]|nr:NADH-quinone oxidoreductase subunit N [Rhodothermaceae bacterium RA]